MLLRFFFEIEFFATETAFKLFASLLHSQLTPSIRAFVVHPDGKPRRHPLGDEVTPFPSTG